jgi:predicted transcriptional regulator of viral defense system
MRPLDSLFGSRAQIDVLRLLCHNHHTDLSVSELSRETGVDKSLVSKAVAFLEKKGAVTSVERGRLKLCRINKACRYYDMLEKLFIEESYIEHSENGV